MPSPVTTRRVAHTASALRLTRTTPVTAACVKTAITSAILAPESVLFSIVRHATAPSSAAGSTMPKSTAMARAPGGTCATTRTTTVSTGMTTSSRKPCDCESSLATACVRPAAWSLAPYWMTATPNPPARMPETTSMRAVRKARRP